MSRKNFHQDLETSPERGLGAILLTQFTGAFNDSAWKIIVKLLAIQALLTTLTQLDQSSIEERVQWQTFVISSAFTLPLMFFSLPSGFLADRFSKQRIMVWVKGFEALMMLAGFFLLLLSPHNVAFLTLILAFMGIHSAVFSPAKYGILPELLPKQSLTKGNARLELWTFVAIIAGTGGGGFLLQLSGGRPYLVALFLSLFSCVGFVASLKVPPVQAMRTSIDTGVLGLAWKNILRLPQLRMAVAANIVFWFLAALLDQNVLIYAKAVLRVSDAAAALPLTLFGVGIGLGSLLAERWSHGDIAPKLIAWGASLMGVCLLLTSLLSPELMILSALMILLGTGSGLASVPIQALIQWHAPADIRGAVISQSNFLTFGGVFLGGLLAWMLSKQGQAPGRIFLWAAFICASGWVYFKPSAYKRSP